MLMGPVTSPLGLPPLYSTTPLTPTLVPGSDVVPALARSDERGVRALDRLARLAAQVTGAPAGLVTVVEADRQRFLGAYGLQDPLAAIRETPLSHSFCRLVVASGGPLVVGDAGRDARVSSNPAIDVLRIAAYAGVPWHARDGRPSGAVCVFAHEPRTWTPGDLRILSELALWAEAEAQVARIADEDQLTGLANRHRLERQLSDGASPSSTGAALLFVDLDQFKVVNATLGHDAGDELLRQVARRLRRVAGPGRLVARHGGDEFIVLLEQPRAAPSEEATALARAIHAALEEPFVVSSTEFQIGASIGISVRDGHERDRAPMLVEADAAMYQAKRAGRNRFSMHTEARAGGRGKLTLTTRLRRALAAEEFVLHYQPIYDLASEVPVSVEALIRWNDPRHGLLSPGAFIPHAEETGLIDEIGEWVLETACEQAARWHAAGAPCSMAVNVAASQLRRPQFVERVASTLRRHRLPASALTVEITESAAIKDGERSVSVLRRLSDLGAKLALDDFGAEYSSLTRLRQLPVDVMKIDRSFMRDVPHDASAAAVVAGIVMIARALGMQPVAEGVEHDAQRRFLVSQGCPLGQGYQLCRPLPVSEVTARLLAAHAGGSSA